MQLHMQAAQKEKTQEKTESAETETFLERMERIHRRNQKREEMLAKQERYRKQAIRKERQEAYEAQLMLRKRRQQALEQQYIMKKIGERKANEKRGSLLMLARSADGRLPVSAEVK